MVLQPESGSSITKVWANNFRSIEHADLELDPLTVLVGPNASGKSNLLDILGLFADTVRYGIETAVNSRGGIDSIGRRARNGRVLNPEIGFRYDSPRSVLEYSFTLDRLSEGDFTIKREFAKLSVAEPQVESCEVEFADGKLVKPSLNEVGLPEFFKGTKEPGPERLRSILMKRLEDGFGDQNLQLISSGFLPILSLLDLIESNRNRESAINHYPLHQALRRATNGLSRIHHYHIFPNSLREIRKSADPHPLSPGGENLASTLRGMLKDANRFTPDLRSALGWAVPEIRDFRVKRLGSFEIVELKHQRADEKEKGTWFDLSFESDGTIRLLAMLTALFQEPALPLIGLEEPELAIHPGAMAVLAETMREASLRGQVVVATHSPDLIDRLPVESIRAVSAESGSTKVGRVAPHQLKSVREGLFSAGELHGLMGLYPEDAGE